MLHCMRPEIFYNIRQCEPDYASQTAMPMERRIQFMLLSVIYRTHVLLIIWSLKEKFHHFCRNPDQALHSFKVALRPMFLSELKRAPYHHNSSTFKVHIAAEKCKKLCACGNHTSVSKNLHKVEKTMRK